MTRPKGGTFPEFHDSTISAFGFWVGIAGGITVADGTVWAGSASGLADGAADPVGEFLALASVEN